jgi:hypothetical protein
MIDSFCTSGTSPTSESGKRTLHGRGVAHVRATIQKAFEAMQFQIASELAPKPQMPVRPLAERAAPLLKVAERHLRHSPLQRRPDVYEISIPTETPEELFAEALRLLDVP